MRIGQFISGEATDHLVGGLLLVGLDGAVLDVNDAALDCYGYSRSEALALRLCDLRASRDQGVVEGLMPDATQQGAVSEEEHRRSDGTPFPVEIRSLLVGIDGDTALLASVRDITERVQAQNALAVEPKRLEATRQDMTAAIIDMVGNVSEMRDPFTAGHQRRVAEVASAIALEMDMSDADIGDIRVAGLIHDIGKMSVPAGILTKPTTLSSIEFNLVQSHAEAGYGIITAAQMHDPIAELVYQHHERCDGSGYPRGLGADELLTGSKVLMVADVVEAMMSNRSYRASLGQDAALAEIEQGAGRLYDSLVTRACLRIFREEGFAFSET